MGVALEAHFVAGCVNDEEARNAQLHPHACVESRGLLPKCLEREKRRADLLRDTARLAILIVGCSLNAHTQQGRVFFSAS